MPQIADDLFFATGTAVNWILARDGSDLTLIDTGYPGDGAAVEASVRQWGHRMHDIQAVLVTHCHVDHIGNAVDLHRRYGMPVYVDGNELPNAHGHRQEQATTWDVVSRCWQPRVLGWALTIARAGAAQHQVLPFAQPLPTGDPTTGALDLPGRPMPVCCPGHTSGHCAYLIPDAGVLASGDALITGHEITSVAGPQMLPDFFSASPCAAIESLDALATVDADTLAPGHGPSYRGDLAVAVDRARSRRT